MAENKIETKSQTQNSPEGSCLPCLISERILFESKRSLVAFKCLLRSFSSVSKEILGGGLATFLIIVLSFSIASAKFNCCDLVTSDFITRHPSLLIFVLY